MVTLRSRESATKVDPRSSALSYEDYRKERIKENLQRMQEMGIANICVDPPASKTPKRPFKKTTHLSPRSPIDLPPRRSSRLQNVTPVSYLEYLPAKKEHSEGKRVLIREGLVPEVYTEEHLKLLGSWKDPWILFQDGYTSDGVRIYDPVIGKTCHQCRQKTLGHRTHCSKCNLVQGQFCGDCLFMRYGENVLEANKKPEWICPVCRGICNCSLCRQKKGWLPTGSLYKKVTSLGHKSVAHYLIQSLQSNNTQCEGNAGKMEENAHRMSGVKISLDFSDPDHAQEEAKVSTAKSMSDTDNELRLDPLNAFIDTYANTKDCVSDLKPQGDNLCGQVSTAESLENNHEIVDHILQSSSKDLREEGDVASPRSSQKLKRNLDKNDFVDLVAYPESIGTRVRRRHVRACS